MMSSDENNNETYEQLAARYEQLDAEHRNLKFKLKSIIIWPLFVFGLPKKIAAYRSAVKLRGFAAQPESDELIAALATRLLIGTVASFMLSLLTIVVLFKQTEVFSKQADLIGQQNEFFRFESLNKEVRNIENITLQISTLLDSINPPSQVESRFGTSAEFVRDEETKFFCREGAECSDGLIPSRLSELKTIETNTYNTNNQRMVLSFNEVQSVPGLELFILLERLIQEVYGLVYRWKMSGEPEPSISSGASLIREAKYACEVSNVDEGRLIGRINHMSSLLRSYSTNGSFIFFEKEPKIGVRDDIDEKLSILTTHPLSPWYEEEMMLDDTKAYSTIDVMEKLVDSLRLIQDDLRVFHNTCKKRLEERNLLRDQFLANSVR